MRLAVVFQITGTLVRLFSPALVAPALVAALYREWYDTAGFAVAFAATALVGTVMRRAGRASSTGTQQLRRIEGLVIVAGTWMVIAHLAAIPYMWGGLGFIDALFESMSGLTTTGAT